MEQPGPTPMTGPSGASAHWTADPALIERLFTATLTLLDLLDIQLGDHPVFSQALEGGGEHVCELADLDPSWAPVIETDAVRLVAGAAGLPAASAFSPAMPHMIAAIDRQPPDVQRALVQRASAHHVGQGTTIPNAQFIGAVAQRPVRPPRYAQPSRSDLTAAWSVEDARARTTAPQAATQPDRTATAPGQQHTSAPTPPRSAPLR
ncbi:hypothetical protein ACFXJ5_09070 [Streptomyces sp. NPDC059373]